VRELRGLRSALLANTEISLRNAITVGPDKLRLRTKGQQLLLCDWHHQWVWALFPALKRRNIKGVMLATKENRYGQSDYRAAQGRPASDHPEAHPGPDAAIIMEGYK
jgi:hypothetical protein